MRFFLLTALILLGLACNGGPADGVNPPPFTGGGGSPPFTGGAEPPPFTERPTPASPTLPPGNIFATAPVITPVPLMTQFAPATPVSPEGPVAVITPLPDITPVPIITPVGGFPGVRVGKAQFRVDVADDVEERSQGLSGHPGLGPREGMLFVFEDEGRLGFWMKGMLFPLDMVWIDAQCSVVDITVNAPVPEPGQSQLPTYSPSGPAQYVLEINAGEADRAGISPGDSVAFTGSLKGVYGC